MKLVSVIIPLYNTEKYIEETIQSVIKQSYPNIEVIVIDDGSHDNSADIIKKVTREDERVSYHYQNNNGVSIARNNGIEKTHGEYVFFLDADDVWLTDHIEKRIALFEKDSSIQWTFGSIELIDEKSKKLKETIFGSDTNILNDLLSWNGNVITTPSTICVRRDCLINTSFDKNLSTAADQDFAIQLASKYKGKYCSSPTVLYRVLPNSMSRNIQHMEEDHIRVYNKAVRNKLFKGFWFKQKCFSNLYWILAGSWWKNGKNKARGAYFILLGLLANPLSFVRLFKG